MAGVRMNERSAGGGGGGQPSAVAGAASLPGRLPGHTGTAGGGGTLTPDARVSPASALLPLQPVI